MRFKLKRTPCDTATLEIDIETSTHTGHTPRHTADDDARATRSAPRRLSPFAFLASLFLWFGSHAFIVLLLWVMARPYQSNAARYQEASYTPPSLRRSSGLLFLCACPVPTTKQCGKWSMSHLVNKRAASKAGCGHAVGGRGG